MEFFKESETVELKESTSQTSRAIESITSMLNKHGHAVIFFGVNNKGEPTKQSFTDKTIVKLSHEITNNIVPQVIPIIQFVNLGNYSIIKVEVFGNDQPYSAYDKFYIRSGTENKKLLANEIKNLVLTYMPNVICEMEALNQSLTFNTLKTMYREKQVNFNENNFYKNNGLLTKQGKFNLLAELISDYNTFSVKVVKFDGNDKTKILFRKEFGFKSLLQCVYDVINYVEALNETKVIVSEKPDRDEIHLFDSKCFREAWINACLHNKWCGYIPPSVYIYDDRIEIVSYGGLPLNLTLDDFYNGISAPVNKQLQFIMGKLNLVEQTGHGVPEIISKYGTEAFKITQNNVIVTLKFNFILKTQKYNISSQVFLNKSELNVYHLISNNQHITTKEIAKLLKMSTSSIGKILSKLRKNGFIIRKGSNKAGYWQILK